MDKLTSLRFTRACQGTCRIRKRQTQTQCSDTRKLVTFMLLLALSSFSTQTDIIQRGITFPCLFYLGSEEKYFFLYEMQTTEDTTLPMTSISGGLTINFCQAVFTRPPPEVSLPIETSGAGYYQDLTSGTFYALSYFNGYGNTTKWNVERYPSSSDENFQGIKITGDNSGMVSSNLVSSVQFLLICSSGIKGDDYTKTLEIVSWNPTSKSITIQANTEFGCGNQPSWLITLFAMVRNVGHVLLLVGALPLLFYGYKTLRFILITVAFLFGLIYSLMFFLEGSNPNLWDPAVILVFLLFGCVIGVILAHSSYYFPHGAVYFSGVYLGLYVAAELSKWISLGDRFYLAYLLIHLIFPTVLAYFFHKALEICTIVITAFTGAVCLLLFIQVFLSAGVLPAPTDYLDPLHVVSNYPTTFFVLVLLTTLGVTSQQYVYNKTDALKVGHVSQIVIAIQPPEGQGGQQGGHRTEPPRRNHEDHERRQILQMHQEQLRLEALARAAYQEPNVVARHQPADIEEVLHEPVHQNEAEVNQQPPAEPGDDGVTV